MNFSTVNESFIQNFHKDTIVSTHCFASLVSVHLFDIKTKTLFETIINLLKSVILFVQVCLLLRMS